MWKCPDCGAMCNSEFCENCGCVKPETVMNPGMDELKDEVRVKSFSAGEKTVKSERYDGGDSLKYRAPGDKRVSTESIQLKNMKRICAVLAVVLVLTIVAGAAFVVLLRERWKNRASSQDEEITQLRQQLGEEKLKQNALNGNLDSQNAQNSALADEKAELASSIEDLEADIEQLQAKLESRDSEISDLKSEKSEMQDRLDFYDNNIKIVEDDTGKTYHKYGCEHLDMSYYWAHNKEWVENDSQFTKCPYCN